MNIEEYDKRVGFEPSPPHCSYCSAPRFYKDLCIEHTRKLMVKVGVVSTLFVADSDITKFLDEAINESQIYERIDAINDAISHLYNVDKLTVEQVARALDVSKDYVQGVL